MCLWPGNGFGTEAARPRIAARALAAVALTAATLAPAAVRAEEPAARSRAGAVVPLPPPRLKGTVSLEEALAARRSVRAFSKGPLTLGGLSQLLWAAQGITDPRGLRTAPSAGALYPLEIFVVAGAVASLPPGVYRYQPREHRLTAVAEGDRRASLAAAALGQSAVREAPAVIAIAAEYGRTTGKYRERGVRYVHMEAGHAAQNVCLEAAALDLATVVIGAFSDEDVTAALHAGGLQPLYLIPVGTP